MSVFNVNRDLLNPKFEGYKLFPVSQDEAILRFPLPSHPTQANISGRTKTPLSLEEVQSRITHNHLAVGIDGNVGLYVDEDFRVVVVRIDSESLEPVFNTVFELGQPIQSPEVTYNLHREYPSSVHIQGTRWVVSDGYGQLYVLSIEDDQAAKSVGVYHLPQTTSGLSTPFKIHSGHYDAQSETALCVVSARLQATDNSHGTASNSGSHSAPRFGVWIVSLPIGQQPSDEQALKILWRGHGDDVPVHSDFHFASNSFVILGSPYTTVGVAAPPSYDPTPDELMPIPRAGESETTVQTKPPTYSWTQTSDSVTVAFPLPSHIPKIALKVTLTMHTLTLLVHSDDPGLPRYSLKQFWDGIVPSSSVWTWDKDAEHKYGLLTLHLEKQNEGTRWAHVFASVGSAPSGNEMADPADAEVPETLDPSELWLIRESLEKYTSALNGEDSSGLGLGRGVPSLADGEMDDTVDDSVGREVWVTWVSVDGSAQREEYSKSTRNDFPSELLATPMPGIDGLSLVVKSTIDGLLFSPPQSGSAAWTHELTYPALAFVLASKRDTRFVLHLSSKAVLAFESASGPGGGNVYVYWSPAGKQTWAKQTILKVAGGTAGALLGVGALKTKEGYVIASLCENELVVLKPII
ncbi:hypothetical protein BD410DRAFT_271454 [Rickenella mellea]|uniref:NudC domain-containing protein 1 n=1 Tax=Rickenella mellea TaxID=50990 RepID=A0A4Y7Q5L8_9AGAM|nr:hypothetical protein BD410DRAFT_271454 [Rickenella mellea]